VLTRPADMLDGLWMGLDRVRLGVIGVGNIARLNVQGYLDHPHCDVVAVCDTNVKRAEALAEEWGVASVYEQVEDLLADRSIDAVEILTPTYLHHRHVMAALEAGKHVSVQKPIANTVAEAREMEHGATSSGLTLRVSECYGHYPPLERARALIRDGAIGRPTALRIKTVVGQTDSAFQAGLEADGYVWRLNAQSPGGHLFDDMVHKYAMALWLVDQDIVNVQAVVRRRDFFFEPCAAIFEYEDPDLLGMMEASYAPQMWMRSRYYGADEFFEIQGDEGFLWVTRCTGEMLDLAPVMLYRGRAGGPIMTDITDIDADWGSGFRRSSAHFVDALRNDTPADMSPEDAIKVLQLCFAVYEAGNTNSRIDPRTITGSVVPTGWAEW
jgi:predicted dehydrogenase